MSLSDIFREIDLSQVAETVEFLAVPIPAAPNHRIAKDRNGLPALLLFGQDKVSKEFAAAIRLENITVDFDVLCSIREDGSTISEAFSVLRFIGQNAALQDYFFKLSNTLLENLGNQPTKRQINYEIHQLVELLRFASETPRKTVQGLWAELFLISKYSTPAALLGCWHSTPEDKFDFSNGRDRIEVKSSAGGIRSHTFSIEQLNPPDGVTIFIASMFVLSAANGLSIRDLELDIAKKVANDAALLSKLRLLVGRTLGSDFNSSSLRFDSYVAAESLRFYKAEDVPRIISSTLHPLISQVKFQSNLENAQPVDLSVIEEFFN